MIMVALLPYTDAVVPTTAPNNPSRSKLIPCTHKQNKPYVHRLYNKTISAFCSMKSNISRKDVWWEVSCLQ